MSDDVPPPELGPTRAEIAAMRDVVARVRKLEEVLVQEELRGHARTQAVYDAHFNLIGALAVYDDKGKQEQTDGEG